MSLEPPLTPPIALCCPAVLQHLAATNLEDPGVLGGDGGLLVYSVTEPAPTYGPPFPAVLETGARDTMMTSGQTHRSRLVSHLGRGHSSRLGSVTRLPFIHPSLSRTRSHSVTPRLTRGRGLSLEKPFSTSGDDHLLPFPVTPLSHLSLRSDTVRTSYHTHQLYGSPSVRAEVIKSPCGFSQNLGESPR
ncbi:hypothetical protein DPEC_G00155330 [Dallia pectoralis]|uniref:Uncharacterized protein n=1 Tax=Dallia pectoralis TaxID=75939 RepID=A0ACC2GKG6_DALPE|nr:hypothetical protein DPEC_G00155330 [Dallia pectoralis]